MDHIGRVEALVLPLYASAVVFPPFLFAFIPGAGKHMALN